MSDPVTTAEVEDVLSSIRRLVSEEKRPLQTDDAPKLADRLVLTPALRVPEIQPAKQSVTSDLQAAFDADQAEGEASDDISTLVSPNVADDAHSQPFDLSAHAQKPKTSEVLSLTSADLADDYSDDPYQFDEIETDNAAVVATPLPPLTLEPESRSDAEWAADALAEAEAVAESVTLAERVELPDDITDEPIAEIGAASATKAATLSAKIEALESAIGGIEDDFEPDEVSDDAYSGTHAPALAWEDDLDSVDLDEEPMPTTEDVFATDLAHDAVDDMSADADEAAHNMASDIADDTVRELHQPLQEAVFAAAATSALADADSAAETDLELASETRLLDEDALRDMVGDIVRSELQGALGERITRNVRKLVRREIHRALTTQDLD